MNLSLLKQLVIFANMRTENLIISIYVQPHRHRHESNKKLSLDFVHLV